MEAPSGHRPSDPSPGCVCPHVQDKSLPLDSELTCPEFLPKEHQTGPRRTSIAMAPQLPRCWASGPP